MGRASTSEMIEIGKKIKHYLELKKWSQEELAAKVGISPSAMSDIINGKREPKVGLFCRIASALGRELSDLEPESVFNSSEYDDKLEEVIHDIRHIHNGLKPDDQAFMIDQLGLISGSYAGR